MSVEIACTCDDLPAHSHIYRSIENIRAMRVDYVDTGDLRIWVDWKAVARELAVAR